VSVAQCMAGCEREVNVLTALPSRRSAVAARGASAGRDRGRSSVPAPRETQRLMTSRQDPYASGDSLRADSQLPSAREVERLTAAGDLCRRIRGRSELRVLVAAGAQLGMDARTRVPSPRLSRSLVRRRRRMLVWGDAPARGSRWATPTATAGCDETSWAPLPATKGGRLPAWMVREAAKPAHLRLDVEAEVAHGLVVVCKAWPSARWKAVGTV
jgi:hypothetical protein